jgi:GNAT superfamily N-acetyltransferase
MPGPDPGVREFVRRLGVGDVVARALIQHARESGIRLVTATTPLGWAPGLAFLEHLGFALEAPEEPCHQSSNRNLGPREVVVRRGSLRLGS